MLLSILLPARVRFPKRELHELKERNSIHQFVVKDLQGNDFDFSSLKGKKLIVVNTASKCGLTPQYKQLQELFDKYSTKAGFEIIGFPSNDFLKQEPGTAKDIEAFCELNYGVTFRMMSKISVKGKTKHPLFQFLTQKSRNGVLSYSMKWNFQKFLIDENGFLVTAVAPIIKPNHPKIISWILSK